jgi:hypothetical protein
MSTEFGTPVGQNPQQRDAFFLEKRQHEVIEDIGGGKSVFAVVEFGEGHP